MKLFKLLLVYCGRTSTHKLAGVLYLWERYYISKAVGVADYHGKSVKSYAHAAMRWCGITIGVYEEAELCFYLFVCHAQCLEHLLLKLKVCYSH